MSLKNIKGQDRPIRILQGYLKSAGIQGAYLFTGEEGIGKLLAAENLAKALNCLNEGEDSCDHCPSCIKIGKRGHPDVHLIGLDPDTIKIDSIRELKREIGLRPYEAKKKVFIVNNAHNLSSEAAGAILKVLEEPPRDSIIILVTAKPALLFKTIISRCKIIKFSPLKRIELKEILKQDYSLNDDTAHFLAYFCEGRIGYALRLKETDILTEKNVVIDLFTSSGNSGIENARLQNRENLRSQLNILTSWFRDIYLIKTGTAHSELINFDRKTELLKDMNRYTLFNVDEIIKSISDSMLFLEQNVNVKLLLSNLKAEIWKN